MSAINDLNKLIKDGIEFGVALNTICLNLKLNETARTELINEYDND